MKPSLRSKLFTATLTAAFVLASYSQALAGPYYYDGTDQGGDYYDNASPNGHGYVGITGGITNTQRTDINAKTAGKELRFDLDGTIGGLIGLRAGWLFPDSGLFKFALEGEGMYSASKLEGTSTINGVPTSFESDFSAWVLMGNGMVRLDLGAFEPYLGAGIGAVHASTSGAEAKVGGSDVTVEDVSEWGWAYQILVGGEFMLFNDRLGLFAEYKYMSFQAVEQIEDFRQHVFGGGLRIHF